MVARTLGFAEVVDPLSDVGRLGGDVNVNVGEGRICGVHADGVVGVTDRCGGGTCKGRVIRSRSNEGHLTCEHDDALVGSALDEGFNGHAGVRVHGQTCIDDRIRNGVTELVWVARGYRFGREEFDGHDRGPGTDAYERSPQANAAFTTMA